MPRLANVLGAPKEPTIKRVNHRSGGEYDSERKPVVFHDI
jgi:hypothetical protein